MTKSVTHAPWVNFRITTATRMRDAKDERERMDAGAGSGSWPLRLRRVQLNRLMPSCESEKVTNTLIAYIVTSTSTEPLV